MCLQVFLHRLKPDISQTSWDETTEKHGTLYANVLLLTQSAEDVLGKGPYHRHYGVEQRQDKEPPLQQNAEVMLIRGSRETARSQCIECCSTSQCDEPRRGHGEHVGEGGCRQGLGGEAAHDEDGDGLEGVL